MPTTLDKRTLKKAIDGIRVQGFTGKYWREYRGKPCQGKKVGVCLLKLSKLKVPESGDPRGIKNKIGVNYGDLIAAYAELHNALKSAHKACGLGYGESKQFCAKYLELTKQYIHIAQVEEKKSEKETMLQEHSKAEKKIEKEKEKVLKALRNITEFGAQNLKQCEKSGAELDEALSSLGKVQKSYTKLYDREGSNRENVLESAEKLVNVISKKAAIRDKIRFLRKDMRKHLKDFATYLKSHEAASWNKKETNNARLVIRKLRESYQNAASRLDDYVELHGKVQKELDKLNSGILSGQTPGFIE